MCIMLKNSAFHKNAPDIDKVDLLIQNADGLNYSVQHMKNTCTKLQVLIKVTADELVLLIKSWFQNKVPKQIEVPPFKSFHRYNY